MRAADFVADNPGAPYSQALTVLLRRIAPGRSARGRVAVLTAPGSDMGRSVIALCLARLAAAQGLRTVLVDGNFARPVIAPAAGLGSAPAGIVELLNGSAPLSRALLRDFEIGRAAIVRRRAGECGSGALGLAQDGGTAELFPAKLRSCHY